MFFSSNIRHLLVLIVGIGAYGWLSRASMELHASGLQFLKSDLGWPWVIDGFAGGPPEWPGIAIARFTGDPGAATVLYLVLGAVLIALVHRFLRFHGGLTASIIAVLLLATDAHFQLDRQTLGGGALLLQAATLLCLWALWSRRWAGGRHGLTALGVGVGLGLLAHLRFGWVFGTLAVTAALLRWDKPNLRPPLPSRPWMPLLWVGLLVLPFPVVWILGGPPSHLDWTPFSGALPSVHSLRWVGMLFVLGGVITAWQERHPTPHIALLRFVSVWIALVVGIQWATGVAFPTRGVATPLLAILGGLAIDRLASRVSPPRSLTRTVIALALAAPLIATGAQRWAD